MTNTFLLTLQLLLPIFEDFSKKLELEAPCPLLEKSITKKNINSTDYRGSMVLFDDRFQFNFSLETNAWGRIVSYYDRKMVSSAIREHPDRLQELAKFPSIITTNEALQIAKDAIKRLGIDERKLKLTSPEVMQFVFRSSDAKPLMLPLYHVRWNHVGIDPEEFQSKALVIEVSGIDRRIVCFTSLHSDICRINIKEFFRQQGVLVPEPGEKIRILNPQKVESKTP